MNLRARFPVALSLIIIGGASGLGAEVFRAEKLAESGVNQVGTRSTASPQSPASLAQKEAATLATLGRPWTGLSDPNVLSVEKC